MDAVAYGQPALFWDCGYGGTELTEQLICRGCRLQRVTGVRTVSPLA